VTKPEVDRVGAPLVPATKTPTKSKRGLTRCPNDGVRSLPQPLLRTEPLLITDFLSERHLAIEDNLDHTVEGVEEEISLSETPLGSWFQRLEPVCSTKDMISQEGDRKPYMNSKDDVPCHDHVSVELDSVNTDEDHASDISHDPIDWG
jgi:hypothetical protein